MNSVLQLKGRFKQDSNKSGGGGSSLIKNSSVDAIHLLKLKQSLEKILYFYQYQEKYLNKALINVKYNRVIPKSKRVSVIFSKHSKTPDDSIVGAKFEEFSENKLAHTITHLVEYELIVEAIKNINSAMIILKDKYVNSTITENDFKTRYVDNVDYDKYPISKSKFKGLIVDASSISNFDVPKNVFEVKDNAVISIYKTEQDIEQLLSNININLGIGQKINETSVFLTPDQLKLLQEKAPYLVAMATIDMSKLSIEDIVEKPLKNPIKISAPKDEPIIGVIDTLFDETVYFSEWVEFENLIDENISISSKDYEHGTRVTSIIVDGASFNPSLDDGCGNFRVKHFGVATSGKFSSVTILKSIRQIIRANKHIKVWNLSLGSTLEIHKDYASIEAAVLDELQYENDCIFIVAGTNKSSSDNEIKRIGAPADSINSLVVNSVDFQDNPASYTRVGPVLSFFNKPDVSYYGGDGKQKIRACSPNGEVFVAGTSYAAPWITRKMAYLIYKLGLNREVAKALIIDSTTDWISSLTFEKSQKIGFGVVPIHIDDIVKSKEDEIKFILTDISEKYDTYTYNLPVPIHKQEHPFVARATVCYFPKCSRNQGVDYTSTEFDIQFGRINIKTDKNGISKEVIKSIDKNNQSDETAPGYLKEEHARARYRKWDNTKHIKEVLKKGARPKKAYETGMWGLSVKTKERLTNKSFGDGMRFGIVVTLKEITGKNRIDEFIKQCSLRGWLVTELDVENQIEVYNKASEDIEWE